MTCVLTDTVGSRVLPTLSLAAHPNGAFLKTPHAKLHAFLHTIFVLTLQTSETAQFQPLQRYKGYVKSHMRLASVLFSTTTSSIISTCPPESQLEHVLSHTLISFPQSTKRIGQGAIRDMSQWQRYAFFSCCAHQLMSKHGPRATRIAHVLRRSTSSAMIHL